MLPPADRAASTFVTRSGTAVSVMRHSAGCGSASLPTLSPPNAGQANGRTTGSCVVLARYATSQVGGPPSFHSESHRVGHPCRFFGLSTGCIYQAGGGSQFPGPGNIGGGGQPLLHNKRETSPPG